nr:hypothetical protein [uncultured Oscillibacter sp.]
MWFNNGNNDCSCLWLIILIVILICCCGNGFWGSSCGCNNNCNESCC